MTRCGLYFGGRTIRFTGLDVTGEGNQGIKGDFWVMWLSSYVVVSLTERYRKTGGADRGGSLQVKSSALDSSSFKHHRGVENDSKSNFIFPILQMRKLNHRDVM